MTQSILVRNAAIWFGKLFILVHFNLILRQCCAAVSPYTDVLILLMNLVSHGWLGALTKLNVLIVKGSKYRSIYIPQRVNILGKQKC